MPKKKLSKSKKALLSRLYYQSSKLKKIQKEISKYRDVKNTKKIDFEGEKGEKIVESEIPANLKEEAQNWHHKIEKGWYGFSFGNVPMIWAVILNEFLIELDKETEGDFKILQNKLKYGSARLYYSYDGEKFPHIYDEINKLEKALFSKDLIY